MSSWWNEYPWRMIQPNFREIDTENFDENRFIEELNSFSCNAVMLNAAGLMAGYPSDLADHENSRFIDHFDLKRVVDLCHENGIKVIARTDFSKIPESVFERHPDWAYRHADGSELNYNGYVQTCLLGGYQHEYMDEILKEMFEKIPFDGIYCNMGSATGYIVDYSMKRYGPCQCDNCKAAFKAKTGMDVPTELRPGDKASMIYFGFQQEIAGAQKKRITALLKKINPELAYCSVDYSRQEAHTDFNEQLPAWQYMASSAARMMNGMDVPATVANVDFMGFPYRHPSCTGALQELRLWQTLSNFAGIDYYVIGRLYDKADKSTFERVKRVFNYAKTNEALMCQVESVSDVLLVKDSYIIPNPEERGWVRLLIENHIFFDETLMGGLMKKNLAKYKAVILPEKARLPEIMQEKLNKYVNEGGIVIAAGNCVKTAALGIAEILKADQNTEGAMFSLDAKDFPSFENRPLMIVGEDYLPRVYEENVRKYGAFCKPERFGPPELCYATEAPTDLPALTVNECGKGKGITIPWHIGTDYYKDGHEAFRLFVKDVLLQYCGIESADENLCPMVEVTHGRKGDAEIIHFVNAAGHYGNSYFDAPVLSDQSVTIAWDSDSAVCENLDCPGNIEYSIADGKLKVTVPKLGFHACVVIRKN